MTGKTQSRSTSALRLGVLLSTTALSLSALGGAAHAQQASEQIVVTGTRANLANFQAPTPTQVVGVDLINKQAVTSVATVLNQNPAFKGLRSPQGNTNNQGSPAQATADLRGLGGQRTLVLMNGVRIVPFAPAANLSVPTVVDLNLVPTIMIDHVDVVTGGANAQWGSDAVGGVVNLIMRNNFNGFEVRGQTGQSTYGDNKENRIAMIAGTNLFGDKAHVVLAFDGTTNTGMGDATTRPWGRLGGGIFTQAAGKTPALLNINGIHSGTPYGGLIFNVQGTNTALNNLTFTSPTTVGAFDHGTLNNGTSASPATSQIGGNSAVTPLTGTTGQLVPAVRKASVFSYMSYQVTPDIKAYLQMSYAYSLGIIDSQVTAYGGSFGLTGQSSAPITIACDNAYLDPSIRAQITSCAAPNGPNRVTAFTYRKSDYSIGGLGTYVTNTQPRFVAGVDGDLGKFVMGDNWRWDAHLTYGQNFYHGNYKNVPISGNGSPAPGVTPIYSHVALAADAVTVTPANAVGTNYAVGSVQCRALLPYYASNFTAVQLASAPGCVPYNFFGPQTSGNKSYMVSDAVERVWYDLADAAANIHGEPFNTWAGPVAVATGLEYRYEHEKDVGDYWGNLNAYSTSANDPSYSGQFNVIEGYLETNAPLAKDQFFTHSLNVDGALRYAHYSDVGNQFTWKVGLNYEPIEGVRFRATESQDIRAPQIWELANPGSGQINVLSPCLRNNVTLQTDAVTCAGATGSGSQSVPQNSTQGSPNVKPENASTTTLGIVLEPPATWANGWLRGFNMSVDWYDINIVNAITNIQGATAVPLCNAGQTYFCSLFSYNAQGIVTAYTSPAVNFGGVENIGYEFVISYRKNLSDWGLPWAVRSSTSLTGSYVDHIFVNPGLPGTHTIDRAGENGQNNQSTGASEPHVRANLNQSFDYGPASLTFQALFVSRGVLDNTYNTGGTNTTIDNNQVAPYWKFDLSASYMLTPHLQVFGVVNNLTDAWPARSPYAVLANYTSGAYYDKTGRAFTIGFDYKY